MARDDTILVIVMPRGRLNLCESSEVRVRVSV